MNAFIVLIVSLRNTLSLDNARMWLLLVGAIALGGITYLGQATEATVTGQHVHELRDRLDRTERQNAQLEFDIAALLAPERLEARARALGLRPPTGNQMRFMTIKDYVPGPVKPTVAEPDTNPTRTKANDSSDWWSDLTAGVRGIFGPDTKATPNP